jgi:hypothetical protein
MKGKGYFCVLVLASSNEVGPVWGPLEVGDGRIQLVDRVVVEKVAILSQLVLSSRERRIKRQYLCVVLRNRPILVSSNYVLG